MSLYNLMCYLSGEFLHQNQFPVTFIGPNLSLATCVLLFNRCVSPCPLHIIYITSTSSIQKHSFVNALQNRCS